MYKYIISSNTYITTCTCTYIREWERTFMLQQCKPVYLLHYNILISQQHNFPRAVYMYSTCIAGQCVTDHSQQV